MYFFGVILSDRLKESIQLSETQKECRVQNAECRMIKNGRVLSRAGNNGLKSAEMEEGWCV